MRTFITPAVIAVAAVALAVPTANALPSAGNAECNVSADNPHMSRGSDGWIVGKARLSCNQNIDSLKVVAELQRSFNGSWVAVSRGDNRWTVRRPTADTQRKVPRDAS
jgi:hypothetical protein